MNTKPLTKLVTAGMMLGLSMLVSAVPARATLASQVVPVNQEAFSRTYGEWAAAWWQWSFSIPTAMHPIFDKGPCTEGQSGPVFFLGGKACANGDKTCNASTAVRYCTIPSGKGIFFPIANNEDSDAEEAAIGTYPPPTINQLRQVNETGFNFLTDLEVDLDGSSLPNLKTAFHITSVDFEWTVPDKNELQAFGLEIPAGTYSPAVDDGVYLMLKPLSTGSHLLHFHAKFSNTGFQFDITYHLTISP